ILYGFVSKDPKLRLASKLIAKLNQFWRGPGSRTTKFPQGCGGGFKRIQYLRKHF
ncbi:Hypothetical protein FKW44_017368, partial [Caligus rogercresseyi]